MVGIQKERKNNKKNLINSHTRTKFPFEQNTITVDREKKAN